MLWNCRSDGNNQIIKQTYGGSGTDSLRQALIWRKWWRQQSITDRMCRKRGGAKGWHRWQMTVSRHMWEGQWWAPMHKSWKVSGNKRESKGWQWESSWVGMAAMAANVRVAMKTIHSRQWWVLMCRKRQGAKGWQWGGRHWWALMQLSLATLTWKKKIEKYI